MTIADGRKHDRAAGAGVQAKERKKGSRGTRKMKDWIARML
jgi:hypothetical protein